MKKRKLTSLEALNKFFGTNKYVDMSAVFNDFEDSISVDVGTGDFTVEVFDDELTDDKGEMNDTLKKCAIVLHEFVDTSEDDYDKLLRILADVYDLDVYELDDAFLDICLLDAEEVEG